MANRILLRGSELCHFDEAPADAALSPGHLLELNSDGEVKRHSQVGGYSSGYWALEDGLRGRTINDAYATADQVSYVVAPRGVVVNARLKAGENASKGSLLQSAGDGSLMVIDSQGQSVLYANSARSASVTNTTVETAFDKTHTIPAKFLRVGDVLRVRVQCIATSTNSTDTLTLKLKIGSTVVVATAAVDVANNDVGFIEALFVVRTIGATGTIVATGQAGLGVAGTATMRPFYLAETTVDTTGTLALTVTATWSVASASNVVYLDILNVSLERTDANVPVAMAVEALDNSAGVAEDFVAAQTL